MKTDLPPDELKAILHQVGFSAAPDPQGGEEDTDSDLHEESGCLDSNKPDLPRDVPLAEPQLIRIVDFSMPWSSAFWLTLQVGLSGVVIYCLYRLIGVLIDLIFVAGAVGVSGGRP